MQEMLSYERCRKVEDVQTAADELWICMQLRYKTKLAAIVKDASTSRYLTHIHITWVSVAGFYIVLT